jgi:methylmalonyl-CoA/ethylmalonyl-CoA epimerase
VSVSSQANRDETPSPAKSTLRRLDHIAIAVRDTEAALPYFTDTLGLAVVHTDVLDTPPVRLTYLAAGDVHIQLVCPRDDDSDLARWIEERGEGLHHICFSVDDLDQAVADLSDPALPQPRLGSGWGRRSGFIANGAPHGVILECTEWQP